MMMGYARYARLVVVHSASARYDLVRNFVARKFEKLLSTAWRGELVELELGCNLQQGPFFYPPHYYTS